MEEPTIHRPSPATSDSSEQYATLPTITIEPTKGWVPVKLKDLVQFRELLYFLIWSELKVRYKQTILGAAWAIIQPAAIMVVFTIFFGIVVRVPTGKIPYPIFAYSGLVVWNGRLRTTETIRNDQLHSGHFVVTVGADEHHRDGGATLVNHEVYLRSELTPVGGVLASFLSSKW